MRLPWASDLWDQVGRGIITKVKNLKGRGKAHYRSPSVSQIHAHKTLTKTQDVRMFSCYFSVVPPASPLSAMLLHWHFLAAKKENNHLAKSQFTDKMVVIRFNIPNELKGLRMIDFKGKKRLKNSATQTAGF
jgi:hypothetical protein